jgi:hypothetical protein
MFTGNHKEQLTWRDAATGRILAESDFFEPPSINGFTPPGSVKEKVGPELRDEEART